MGSHKGDRIVTWWTLSHDQESDVSSVRCQAITSYPSSHFFQLLCWNTIHTFNQAHLLRLSKCTRVRSPRASLRAAKRRHSSTSSLRTFHHETIRTASPSYFGCVKSNTYIYRLSPNVITLVYGITDIFINFKLFRAKIPKILSSCPTFISLHYTYIIGWTLLTSIIIYPGGAPGLRYVDALFFGSGASTQSGLNTVDVNLLHTYQQVIIWFVAMLRNVGDRSGSEASVHM